MQSNCCVREQIKALAGREICYAGGIITFRNPPTLHHANFKSDGGHTCIYECTTVANLEHTATHILSDIDKRYKKEIHDYYMERIEDLLKRGIIDLNALKQFNEFLHKETQSKGFKICESKDNILIYKKEIKKGGFYA